MNCQERLSLFLSYEKTVDSYHEAVLKLKAAAGIPIVEYDLLMTAVTQARNACQAAHTMLQKTSCGSWM